MKTTKIKKPKRDMVAFAALVVYSLTGLSIAFFIGLFIYAKATVKPPVMFDFKPLENKVVQVDIVDWVTQNGNVYPNQEDNFRVILSLSQDQIHDLLDSLSETPFNHRTPGSPPVFGHRCFLLTLNDGSFHVVCRTGYAHYRLTDQRLTFYTEHITYIEDYDFDDLFAPYRGY